MPPKKKISDKATKALGKFQKELAKIRRDPRYRNKDFHEQQQIASKVYQRDKKK